MRIVSALTLMLAFPFTVGAAQASTATLLHETFDGVTSGYHGSDPRRFGVPNIAAFGADNNWRAGRFEAADGGTAAQDVGVQQYGGSDNTTPVGIAEDDAGLLISFDASLYTDVTLSFDWRTFSAGSADRLVVGYFVGDLDGLHPHGFVDNQIDLRPASHGGADGVWNWDNGWTELLRAAPNNSFTTETFSLLDAAGASEVWLAFWLDGGEHDFAKIDNIEVNARIVPVPAAVWLMASGLFGLLGLRRRR